MFTLRRGLSVIAAAALVLAVMTAVATASTHARPATDSATTTVSARSNKLGTFLVGPNGKTLYLWAKDKKDKSECNSQCEDVWPPLLAKGKLVGTKGVKSSELGSIKISAGQQVTYDGHPLYYYTGDGTPGQTTGEKSDSFGSPWYVVSTSGSAIK